MNICKILSYTRLLRVLIAYLYKSLIFEWWYSARNVFFTCSYLPICVCVCFPYAWDLQMNLGHKWKIRIRTLYGYAYAISEKYAAGTVSVFRHFKIISVTLLFFCIQFRFLHYSHSIRFCQMVMFIISISLNIGNIHWIQSLKLLTRKYIT